ncbi:c-type cytochrome [Hymenobacter sp. AT01-02]|uniref:c-type cytochrome n=1 Tax=Hymenobacter sp. AT01-02 TaxID=1571877 RepID=UPI0006962A36|nr:cytochrome c [Hymenobacter sp. AT01-02]
MFASTTLLRLHLVVVLAFLLFYALKAGLLLLGRNEQLRALRARTRIVDSVLGLLILLSGGVLLGSYPSTIPGWLWLKLGLVLVLLPTAIAAMRRQFKPGVVITLLGFVYVYGLAETGSPALQSPTAAARVAYSGGLAEATATPEAAPPVDTTAQSTATLSAADQATLAGATEPIRTEAAAMATPPAEPEIDLVAGKTLFAQNCAVCHGLDGKLGLNGAHDLTRSNLNATGRVYMVNNGMGKMPSFQKKLTEQQIQEVVAYSLTLK